METLMTILVTLGFANIVILMSMAIGVQRIIDNKTQELQTQLVDTEDKLTRESEELEQTIIFEMVEQRKRMQEHVDNAKAEIMHSLENMGYENVNHDKYIKEQLKSIVEANSEVLQEVCVTKESTIEKLSAIIEKVCQQEMYRYILTEKIYQNKILVVNTANDKKTKN